MYQKIIPTHLGKIVVHIKNKKISNKTPIIFLHGVYFDYRLWESQMMRINDRFVIAVDMPYHGASQVDIKTNWNLNDCADMLLEILEALSIERAVAIGHSWGSMTILRAAHQKPELFEKVVLCNMPFKEPDLIRKITILLQESALFFNKSFYIERAGKALFSSKSLKKNPALIQKIIEPMSKLTRRQIIHTNKAVILDSEDTDDIIKNLTVPALGVVGLSDYVGEPPLENIVTIDGGHIGPLEDPKKLSAVIDRL